MLRTWMKQRARAIATHRVGCVGRHVRTHEAIAHCRVCPCVSVRLPPPNPRTLEERDKKKEAGLTGARCFLSDGGPSPSVQEVAWRAHRVLQRVRSRLRAAVCSRGALRPLPLASCRRLAWHGGRALHMRRRRKHRKLASPEPIAYAACLAVAMCRGTQWQHCPCVP